jgi:hexosaminidase
MLDISRDRVPTIQTLHALVPRLAEWKINQLQLYTEHTFAYRNHSEVWQDASPFTGDDILRLDAHCRWHNIELVPNQNSFGHMERWLKFPRYCPLAEAPDGFEYPWGGWSDTPSTLCPQDPGALALIKELYDELLPHFTSRQFNIGCDETWELGKGRSRADVETRGEGRVYLEYLQRLHALVQHHGRTMQFWGDIIMHHPELIPEIPAGTIALEWGYEATHPFAEHGQKFADAGIPFYVCPGTSSWNAIAGRTDNAIGNLRSAAEHGLAHGAIGFLNTNWGDNGHFEPLPISYLGFAYGAAVSWCHTANAELDLPRALDLHAFEDAAGVLGRLAFDLGNVYQFSPEHSNSTVFSRLLLHPDAPVVDGILMGGTPESFAQAEEAIDRIIAPLAQATPSTRDGALIGDEFRQTAALMRHGCHQAQAKLAANAQQMADVPAAERARLAEELAPLIEEHRRLWRARSREGGLVQSVGRLEHLLQAYLA